LNSYVLAAIEPELFERRARPAVAKAAWRRCAADGTQAHLPASTLEGIGFLKRNVEDRNSRSSGLYLGEDASFTVKI
jgi:hypothetical protein